MKFEEDYNKIKDIIHKDLFFLEQNIKLPFDDENPLEKDILNFLTNPAKRLRPVLGFLFLRCVFDEISTSQQEVLEAVELIHSATLIHDDVIDKAEKRRNEETLNFKFNNNLAVIAGDFLLSIAMEKVISANSIDVLQVFASALKHTCLGEINQYFGKFKITTIEKYVKKSKQKTALLFEIGLLGGVMLKNNKFHTDLNLKKIAIDFAQNFGIAFQIRNDLTNVLNSSKFIINDISLGIYNAPIIFASQENSNILEEVNLIEAINKTNGIEKTKNLMDNYFNKSIIAINELENNLYKKTMLELIELLRIDLGDK